MKNKKKLCCRRRTARGAVSVEILPTAVKLQEQAVQQIQNKTDPQAW